MRLPAARRVMLLLWMAAAMGPPTDASAGRSWRALMSPGPLSGGHEEFEGDCDKCHSTFAGVPDDKCLYCHQGIADRLSSKEGFHASVSAQDCVDCHTDHQGDDGSLTGREARNGFDHGLTGFPLIGGHASVDCSDCHTGSIDGMSSACAQCHEDPHRQTHGTDCGACHIASAWPVMTTPLSAHRTSLDGGHQGLGCKNCHEGGSHLEATVACSACHEQAHGGTRAACETCHSVESFRPAGFDHSVCTCALPEEHQTADCLGCHKGWSFVDTPSLCSACHASEQTHKPLGECSQCHFATSWKKEGNFQHNRDARFKLEAAHLSVSCDGCHGNLTDFRAAPDDCRGCHEEAGRAAHGDFGDCATCHGTDTFSKSSFDHSTTGFPLTGVHERVRCADCHGEGAKTKAGLDGTVPPGRTSPAIYQLVALDVDFALGERTTAGSLFAVDATVQNRTPDLPDQHSGGNRECVDCHTDVHEGTVGEDCADCHGTSAWTPSTFDVERHAGTPLPLEGAHALADCRQCHLGGRLKPLPWACGDCHMDRHAGKLGEDCAECHSAEAFAPVPDFRHEVTGFALDGPHADAGCDACHGQEPPGVDASSNPADCQVCHVPLHNDDLGTDCRTCHELARGSSFADARGMDFAHHATGFPLTRRHEGLACGDCHAVGKPRPIGRCAECHLDPHGGGMSPECEMCHQPDRWRLARFDHSASGWPLRGRHQVTPCALCHVNQRWVGVETECFGCHALDAARAPDNGFHGFGETDCSECHGLWTWRRL